MSASKNKPVNRILINATQQEEVRIALICDQFLENIFIEELGINRNGNIYKAKVTRVVPSLQAAFVDFGSERHGFLPLKEIAPEYFHTPVDDYDGHFSIADVLKEGQELIVQVEKEERGTKGAALTTFITLAGCYLVLMPNNPRAGGISRRIEGDDREMLRDLMNALSVPQDMGVIIRTAGVGRSIEELQWDLDILLRLWDAIKAVDKIEEPPCLIHQESDIVIRAFRDYLRKDVDEIIIDNEKLYNRAFEHLSKIKPEIVSKVKYYEDKAIPLFNRFHIEGQIETAFLRDVRLPSGGYIVIQETEALVAVDVNSARDTKSDDIEHTAFNTNREAAIEVARQLRLRDLGGLIVIDFIDMSSPERQHQIVEIFKEEIKNDKARVQFNRISRFGLLEVSRQRLRPSLKEASQVACPRCAGQGSIRSVESLALYILRLIRQDAMSDNIAEVVVQAPIDVATFLLNEKRHVLDEIDQHQRVTVKILPNPYMESPQYKIDRIYESQTSTIGRSSYSFKEEKPELEIPSSKTARASEKEPIIKHIETPIKPVVASETKSLLQRLGRWFKEKRTAQLEKEAKDSSDKSGGSEGRSHRGGQRRHPHARNGRGRHPQRRGQKSGPYNKRNEEFSKENTRSNFTGFENMPTKPRAERKTSADTTSRSAAKTDTAHSRHDHSRSEQTRTEQVRHEHGRTESVRREQNRTGQTRTEHVRHEHNKPEQTRTEHVRHEHSKPEQTRTEHVRHEHSKPEQTRTEHVRHEQPKQPRHEEQRAPHTTTATPEVKHLKPVETAQTARPKAKEPVEAKPFVSAEVQKYMEQHALEKAGSKAKELHKRQVGQQKQIKEITKRYQSEYKDKTE